MTLPPSPHDAPVLPPYPGIALEAIVVVSNAATAALASEALSVADAIGFDTESKPTFNKGEHSTGPHLIQLATDAQAFLFPVGDPEWLAPARMALEAQHILKVGFGLNSDLQRLRSKLGIDSAAVEDLARSLKTGKNQLGVKNAVAQYLGQAMQKSKKTSTSNWANLRLTERQMRYAADDAQAALRVYRQWLKTKPLRPEKT